MSHHEEHVFDVPKVNLEAEEELTKEDKQFLEKLKNNHSEQHHLLKCETEYYQAVKRGDKKFEIRFNDRNFKKYDLVSLKETVNGVETGRVLPPKEIKYILYGPTYGLSEDYCVFSW